VSISLIALLAGLLAIPAAAQSAEISGVVTNKTTNKPDAAEEVTLLALTEGMQEVAHTKTDASGRYRFAISDAGTHLVHVEHEKASYYVSAPAGATQVDVSVYDVAAKIAGITTKAQMIRIETDQQQVHVVQSYFVDNDSKPARTEIGAAGYSIYVPAEAQMDAAEEVGPGGMPISAPPVATADKGHYAFQFPLRPGETRFEVSYHLPYSGSYSFGSRDSLEAANLAVAVARGMSFHPGAGEGFRPLSDEAEGQTFLKSALKPQQVVAFSVSGSGSFPPVADDQGQGQDQSQGQSQSSGAAGGNGAPMEAAPAAAADNRPGMGLGAPSGDPGVMGKYRWWIVGGMGLVLAAVAGVMLRPRKIAAEARVMPTALAAAGSGNALEALKEELFALETDRLRGKVTETDYAAMKAAVGLVLQHALKRQAGSQG
jgi:hypothetical protein